MFTWFKNQHVRDKTDRDDHLCVRFGRDTEDFSSTCDGGPTVRDREAAEVGLPVIARAPRSKPVRTVPLEPGQLAVLAKPCRI